MFAKLLIVLVFLFKCLDSARYTITDNTTASAYPCKNTKNYITSYDLSQRSRIQHYILYLYFPAMRAGSYVRIRFNDAVNATLGPTGSAKLTYKGNSYISIDYTREKRGALSVTAAGVRSEYLPYVTSIVVNGQERCTEPDPGVFDELFIGEKPPQEIGSETGPTCGRRQLLHTELITHSILTKPGDWPWHAAIYRLEKHNYDYKCGGTLLSKTFVLTAAHCLMIRGINKVFPKHKVKIYLGKYNLYERDYDIQERKVTQIIIHPYFNATNVNNDISLLRLNTEVEFNDIVQPACVWNPEVLNKLGNTIHGTVVGWGFDQNDRLSSQLRQATIPMVDGLTCVFSNNIFFGKYLNQYKFCAGYTNGTSACNGDSGGGFVVFVPDDTKSTKNYGSWYVRGIVSVAVSRSDANICERNSYVLFTDVSKYREWIVSHMSTLFNAIEVDPIDEIEEPTDGTEKPVVDLETTEKSIEISSANTVTSCGRRKLLHVELMTNAETTKPGDWPWHTAIYKQENVNLKYLCGGTLISRNVVISAAGCTHRNKESLTVTLGKYNLLIIKNMEQTLQVGEVHIHEKFSITNLANDIALLKLRTHVVYTDFVQPACLWNREAEIKANVNGYLGTVAGWGYDENYMLSNILQAASFPVVTDEECARKSSLFGKISEGKFCAGFANGTSPCNGDSGGGYMVFLREDLSNSSSAGAWYLKGIVSVASTVVNTSRCDSFNYVFYTNMAIYAEWVEGKLSRWIFD